MSWGIWGKDGMKAGEEIGQEDRLKRICKVGGLSERGIGKRKREGRKYNVTLILFVYCRNIYNLFLTHC